MNILLTGFIIAPLLAASLILPLSGINRRLPQWLAFIVTAFLACSIISLYAYRPTGNVLVYTFGGCMLPIGINLVLDGLSHLILLIINSAAFLAAVYSMAYMERYTNKDKFFVLFMLMVASMNGAVLTGDLLNLFIFMELASVSSAALVAFGTENESIEASIKYLVMSAVASILILTAISMIYMISGSLNMSVVSRALPAQMDAAKALIMVLLLAGFSTKAAIMPFHAWLPDAHPSAPAPISAMLSGVLIKALGIYVLIRIFFNVFGITAAVSNVFMLLGAASIIGGSLLAIGQKDMKRMMACSSISQIGYMIMAIGLATPMGMMGGLLHLLNHSIIKPLLFFTAGAVEYSTGTRQMDKLGGLRAKMPFTSNSSLIGSLAISGLPPFNGFWSKLFIIMACVQAGMIWLAAVAVFGAVMTLAYFLGMQRSSFFGTAGTASRSAKEVPFAMLMPMVTLAAICLIFGLFMTNIMDLLVSPAVVSVASGIAYIGSAFGGF